MKRILLLAFLTGLFLFTGAQPSLMFHEGTFKKRMGMSSHPYRPDAWEKPYFDSAIRTAFPSDLNRTPEKYTGKMVHLMGIVDRFSTDTTNGTITATFLLENKYWNYIEDYSIQDEVMFVSPRGGGPFLLTLTITGPDDLGFYQSLADERKLFMVYGIFEGSRDNLPVISARQVRYIDYRFYTTAVMQYDIKRGKNGEPETDKSGKVRLTDYNFLKIPGAGQNK